MTEQDHFSQGSLIRFQSGYQPRLQSSENLAGPEGSTAKAHLCGYWLETSVPCHMGLSLELILMWQLASP